MRTSLAGSTILFVLTLVGLGHAQKCAGAGKGKPTIVAKGFTSYVLASGLSSPRGLVFDKEGNLLVVEKTTAGTVTAIKLKEEGGCVTVASKHSTGAAGPGGSGGQLNHGITLSPDGSTLYASSLNTVFAWQYNAKTAQVTGQSKAVVTDMNNVGARHFTRTLLALKKAPGVLLVSRGSTANVDQKARDTKTGISQIRAYNISSGKSYKYTDGTLVAWGLRNSIGMGENPSNGGIWSNENGSDDLRRDGTDIHMNSPGEEINYHGTMKDTSLQGKNYGYPECAAAWTLPEMPRAQALKVGMQFSYSGSQAGTTDDTCAKNYVSPRITLPAHWAPIDIAFNSKGTAAYMTAHGSWNRRPADGFKLFAITYGSDGQPTHPSTSTNAAINILTSPNVGNCQAMLGGNCIRPTGVDIDPQGKRLFMASDSAGGGDIYVIQKTDGTPIDQVTVQELEGLEKSTSPGVGGAKGKGA